MSLNKEKSTPQINYQKRNKTNAAVGRIRISRDPKTKMIWNINMSDQDNTVWLKDFQCAIPNLQGGMVLSLQKIIPLRVLPGLSVYLLVQMTLDQGWHLITCLKRGNWWQQGSTGYCQTLTVILLGSMISHWRRPSKNHHTNYIMGSMQWWRYGLLTTQDCYQMTAMSGGCQIGKGLVRKRVLKVTNKTDRANFVAKLGD